MNKCKVCEIEITDKATTCSPRCRIALYRQKSVTENVSVTQIKASVTYRFIVPTNDTIREAKYWYEVPISAIPVKQKDWPHMPDYMNGRQYFLWWKNEFETKDGEPVILNPYPKVNPQYFLAGEGSRRWGA